ncbi:MAG: hypothetical protein WD048_16475 [Chitinophagales bacterium]
MHNKWLLVALFNFLMAALMGLLLRFAFVWEISWLDYRNMMHGHSHIAMLGWVYLALFALFTHFFIPAKKSAKAFYSYLFWFTQFTVLGMMISFPIQGYGAVSISFSALHILASYLFAFKIWKDLNAQSSQLRLLIKSSLIFMLVSTLGIWAMGSIVANNLQSSELYLLAVQFYLHFQFNGWFALAAVALIIYQLNLWGFHFEQKHLLRFFVLYVLALFLTFFHVLDWAYGETYMYALNTAGVILQLGAFLQLVMPNRKQLMNVLGKQSGWEQLLIGFGLMSLAAKVIFQAILIFPEVSIISTVIRNFMIGYIHLTMLGFITGCLFLMLYKHYRKQVSQLGILFFIIGFISTEAILFTQGIFYWQTWGMLPFYHEAIALASVLLPLGIVLFMKNSISYQISSDKIYVST